MHNKEKEKTERDLEWERLDEAFDMLACGGLDPNPPPDHGKYHVCLLYYYMKENNISVDELTQEILDKFLVDPK